jgi:hypothetical protein
VITFPDKLSPDSFSDLKAYLNVFVKKVQRRSEKDRQHPIQDSGRRRRRMARPAFAAAFLTGRLAT